MSASVPPAEIRARAASGLPARERDLATRIGVREAELIAAHSEGSGPWHATPLAADPAGLLPGLEAAGEVMALTRNDHCVIEKVGTYRDWQGGEHAGMVLGEIDLRVFPKHWVHAYAVEKDGGGKGARSIQVFDAAGDAIHKIYARPETDAAAWDALIARLRVDAPFPKVTERAPVEGPRVNPAKADVLRTEWARMTDTHQFLMLVRRLKMNRLGAYRLTGAPFARRLDRDAAAEALRRAGGTGLPVMIFVGNAGCIEIHTGPVERVEPMGPWLNILDPRHDLHLRAGRVAEVWAVEKPTKRGPALSIEAFDAEGGLIFQMFGVRKEDADHHAPWAELVEGLPTAEVPA